MKKVSLILFTLLISLVLFACTPSEAKPVLNVSFNLNGGTFKKDVLDLIEPEYEASIPHVNDNDPDIRDFQLFSNLTTGLRWYNKLFIEFNETLNTYVVVYADNYRASIEHLDLPSYDYIIALHHQSTLSEGNAYLENLFTEGIGTPILFNTENIIDAENLSFKTYLKTYSDIDLGYKSNDSTLLPLPTKTDFDFKGWFQGEQMIEKLSDLEIDNETDSILLEARWESYSLEALDLFLTEKIPSFVDQSITLPLSYSGYHITWTTSHPDVISSTGEFKTAYEPTTVTLTAQITPDKGSPFQKTFEVTVPHKKVLGLGIASSYIYRDYHMVNDAFFETLDIINTAFLKADAFGTITGSAALANIETYIFPKSKEYGNWVIFSLAPESSWSAIAQSATAINNLAENIVEVINTYGFDGVDVDWETPRSGEQVRYTNLMKVVYEKVKANNPRHLVTTAITGGQWQPPMYNLTQSHQYLDFINVMTYGMANTGASYQNALYQRTGAHNTTFNAGRTPATVSIDASIDIFNGYGVPNSKLIIGVAFYGIKHIRTYNSTTNTYSSWANGGSVFYPEIVSSYYNNPLYDVVYDTVAGVPYVISKDGTLFVSFDNLRSIEEKAQYILDNNLGGMMFWEYGTDTSGELLSAMRSGLNK